MGWGAIYGPMVLTVGKGPPSLVTAVWEDREDGHGGSGHGHSSPTPPCPPLSRSGRVTTYRRVRASAH